MSYSQHGEDEILKALMPTPGNLIDIGAYAPFEMSNTRLLIEAGWDATLIELSPEPLKGLVREYGGSERVRVIAAAITTCEQHVREFRITDDAISCDNDEQMVKFREMRPGYSGGFYGKLWVPTLTVKQLIDQFYGDKPIHFVNIDTEGTSCDLALEFMQMDGDWKPKVMCVEYDDKLAYLLSMAQRYGYRAEHFNGVNVILERR